MPAIAYYLLVKAIIRRHGANSILAQAVGNDLKGKMSVLLLMAGILLAFLESWIAMGLYIIVAFVWIIPDRRIEDMIGQAPQER
jgi:hypothetical protein